MPFWLFPLNSCILLTKHHKLLLPDVPCSNARPHVQELMPKPLALPSLRWPLAALENHGRTVALHLHASCFAQVRRRQRCTLVICTLVPTPFRDVFFSPMYFDSFQGNPEHSVLAYVFFWHHFREPKAISIVAKENAYQTEEAKPFWASEPQIDISQSWMQHLCELHSTSLLENGVQTSLPWISCWPVLQAAMLLH